MHFQTAVADPLVLDKNSNVTDQDVQHAYVDPVWTGTSMTSGLSWN